MRQVRFNCVRWVVALSLLHVTAAGALGANSLTNSLTGFTGESSQAATQGAVAAAGLEFASIDGLAEDLSGDPRVLFTAAGARFGGLGLDGNGYAGDPGRNYMRTIENYAFDSFVAEVTVTSDTLATDQFWLGIGSGLISNWGTPDFAGAPTLFITAGDGVFQSNGVQGISGDWENPDPPCSNNDWCSVPTPSLIGANAGTHRLRMTLDAAAKTWFGQIDVDYAGGAFVADATTPTYNLANWYDDGEFVANGWPTQPSKIYFGGDDNAVFKDFSVTIAGAGQPGDFNGDTNVDASDYTVWRDNLGAADETSIGGNGDGLNGVDPADYGLWKTNFTAAGAGAIAAGVPEPTTVVTALLATVGVLAAQEETLNAVLAAETV